MKPDFHLDDEIDEPETLGEFLRAKIMRSGIPAEEMRERARVSAALWQALLSGKLSQIGIDSYTRLALFRIALVLDEKGDALWERFLKERGGEWKCAGKDDVLPQTPFKQSQLFGQPHFSLRSVLIGLVIISAFTASLWATRFWWLRPDIVITSPREERSQVSSQDITLAGKTSRAAKLEINSSQVAIQADTFSVIVPLQQGMNVFEIVAKDRFGREAKVMRYVVKE